MHQFNADPSNPSHAARSAGGRIGELLSRIIPLSAMEVEEILHEQSASSHKRFGDIALQLGFVTPDDVARAWMTQLETRTERVDLAHVGVDSRALSYLDASTAHSLHALPLRAADGNVLVAMSTPPDAHLLARLEHATGAHVRPILTDAAELERALNHYYPMSRAACA